MYFRRDTIVKTYLIDVIHRLRLVSLVINVEVKSWRNTLFDDSRFGVSGVYGSSRI